LEYINRCALRDLKLKLEDRKASLHFSPWFSPFFILLNHEVEDLYNERERYSLSLHTDQTNSL